MKNIFRLSIVLLLTVFSSSCEQNDDIQFTSVKIDDPKVTSANSTVILNEDLEENPAYTLVWTAANYSPQTPISYSVEVAKSGTNFENPVVISKLKDLLYSWSVKELNILAITAGLNAKEEGALDFRVISYLGSNPDQETTTSNVSVVTLIPYSIDAPKPAAQELYLVGAVQAYYDKTAWTPVEAITMNYIGDGTTKVFEAFIRVGADDGFKFISAQADWSELEGNFGTVGGAQDGVLENSGGSGNIMPSEAGFYYLKVDIDNLNYLLVKMNWGIIGSATPNGWDGETAMTYDFSSNTYKISTALADGELKLRSKNTGIEIFPEEDNKDWKFNVGDTPAGKAVAKDTDDGNIAIEKGDYDISLSIDFDGKATVNVTKK